MMLTGIASRWRFCSRMSWLNLVERDGKASLGETGIYQIPGMILFFTFSLYSL